MADIVIPREDNEKLAQDYLAGHGLPELAARYGVTPTAVRVRIIKQGVAMRPRGVRAPLAQERLQEKRQRRERERVEEVERLMNQVCQNPECGTTFSSTRRSMFCSMKCRRRKEYLDIKADPQRHAAWRSYTARNRARREGRS